MRTLVKNISGICFYAVPIKLLINLTRQNIILPFYHAVSDGPLPHLRHLYTIRSEKKFIADLDFFLKHYQPVSFSELYEWIKEPAKAHKPLLALSFDDGLREVYDIVAPILVKKGIPAAIFINTSFTGNTGLFYKYKASLIIDRLENLGHPASLYDVINSRIGTSIRSRRMMIRMILDIDYANQSRLDSIAELLEIDFDAFLRIRKPYMTEIQLMELQSKGFEIGSHSLDHPLYSAISLDEQVRQTRESIRWISERFRPACRLFSFPFIDDGVKADYFNSVFENDSAIVDMSFGSSGLKKEKYPFHLQRIPMEKSTRGATIYIRGEYIYYVMKSIASKNVVKRG